MPTSTSCEGISRRRCPVEGSEPAGRILLLPARRVLIVGATGVLRPAALSCLARGWAVTAVARTPAGLALLVAEAGPRITPVPLDVYDEHAVGAALREAFDDALLYLAAGDDDAENSAADRLQSRVRGTTVRILTSRWTPSAELPAGRWPAARRRVHLLLGEHRDQTTGDARWHTPPEVSAAAISVLDSGSDSILGTPIRSAGKGPVR